MAINLVQDFFNTKVSTKWNSTGAGNFYIAILPTPTNGYLVVNRASASRREIVRYTGKGTDGGGNYITIALAGDRGLGGTTAQTHEIGESAQMNLTSEHWADLDTAIDSIILGGAPNASTSVKGISRLSSAPVSPTIPIAVGDNDPRVLTLAQVGYVPTVDEKAGIAGLSAANLPVAGNGITQSAVLQTQLVSTNTIAVGEADATTKNNDLAQRFVATKTKMRGASLFKKADTGTFTGTVTVSLQADAGAGIAPTGTNLATVTLTNAKWLELSAAEFEAIFTTEYGALVIGAFYWIVVTTSTSDNSNHANLGADTSGGDGTVYYRNATNGWVQLASSFLYYKTLEGNVNQVIKTGAEGVVNPDLLTTRQIFDSSGTWTKPSFGRSVVIECFGSGASGGANVTNTGGAYSVTGGGGGGYKKITIPLSKLPPTVAVTVGAGGVAAVASSTSISNTNGSNGATSSFGSYVSALGGSFGGVASSIAVTGGDGAVSDYYLGSGGDGSNRLAAGSATYGGAGGSGGYGDSDGSPDPTDGTGAAGVSVAGGNGGLGKGVYTAAFTSTASPGETPGGGGGGAILARPGTTLKTATSGAGGNGRVIVTVI